MWRETDPEQDRQWVERCQEGDDRAFESLIQKYQQSIFSLVYHHMGNSDEVEDIVQNIFTKLYFSLPKFDNRRPFYPWLYRIAVNQCYDELRRARRRRVLTFSELNLEAVESIENLMHQTKISAPSPESRRELHALLHEILNQLPEKQRTAVALRDLEQVPYPRIAEILNCSEQAARLKVFRARSRLRALMLKTLKRRRRTSDN